MNETQPSKKTGCLKAFGIGCAVAFIVAILVVLIGGYALKQWFGTLVNEYTETTPRALPALAVPQDRIDATLARVATFVNAIQKDEPAPALVLSADDLNILIQNHPEWKELAGKAHVTIANDQLCGEVSIPLDPLAKFAQGRFLNGAAACTVGMVAGQLVLYITAVEVKGKTLPEQFMNEFRTKNLAEDSNKKPEVIAVLSKLESIELRDNQLRIVPKRKP